MLAITPQVYRERGLGFYVPLPFCPCSPFLPGALGMVNAPCMQEALILPRLGKSKQKWGIFPALSHYPLGKDPNFFWEQILNFSKEGKAACATHLGPLVGPAGIPDPAHYSSFPLYIGLLKAALT